MADRDVEEALTRSFLGRLPPEVGARLRSEGERADYPAGTTIYRAGSDPRTMLVVHGLIRVYMTSPEGRQVTVRYARRGDVLGVPVTVSGSTPVFVQAVTDAVAVSTRPGTLPMLARRDPRVGLWMAEEMAARVDGLLHELARNTFWPVRRRLARHLLDLAANTQQGEDLVVATSHQELADHVGTVREVVARTLGALRAEGYIASEGGTIRLLDAHALAELP